MSSIQTPFNTSTENLKNGTVKVHNLQLHSLTCQHVTVSEVNWHKPSYSWHLPKDCFSPLLHIAISEEIFQCKDKKI